MTRSETLTIGRVQAVKLVDVPVAPPLFRPEPNRATAYLVRVETTDGLVGWGSAPSRTDDSFVRLVNNVLSSPMIGANALRIGAVREAIARVGGGEAPPRALAGAVSAIDIALWDLRGKYLGTSVHHMLGGAHDEIDTYITHGVAYGDQKPYDLSELVEEARELVRQGAAFLKTGVGRDEVISPREDVRRIEAVREAVGDDVQLAIDGASRMSLSEAVELAELCQPLGIAFLEEPVIENDPGTLATLREKISLPVAAGTRGLGSPLSLLVNDSVDILQVNCTHDGGYTGGLAVANAASLFNVQLGHGNGGGPPNVALLAGVPAGGAVEYHYLRWKSYNAIFEGVPQPDGSRIKPPSTPGVGMTPRNDVVEDYAVDV